MVPMNTGFRMRLRERIAPLDGLRQVSRSSYGLCLITLVAVALSPVIHAQGKPEPSQAIPPRVEGAAKPAVDPPNTIRFDESLQHGFFGDLSRPAPPALNRIYGIRVPEAKVPAQEESGAAVSKPAAQAEETGKAKGAEQPAEVKQSKEEHKETGKAEPAKDLVPAATSTVPAAN